MLFEVYLSDAPETWQPEQLPEGRMFAAKPGIGQCKKFSKKAILDTSKLGVWLWPDTNSEGGWAPWDTFSSYLPILRGTDRVGEWQWPLPKE
jgi:hypothetical protein